MKKIYTNLFINPIIFLKRLLAKSKIDNFVGGLLIGAIVSLLVNYLTFQVQDQLQKQRTLEALENEILDNTIYASTLITSNNKAQKNVSGLNYFYTTQKYSNDIWNSSSVFTYVVQLPKDQQAILFAYYIYVQKINELSDKIEKLRELNSSKCTALLNERLIVPDNNYCISLNNEVIREENEAAADLGKMGLNVLKIFHPTKDRLNNVFLKFFLGSDASKTLST